MKTISQLKRIAGEIAWHINEVRGSQRKELFALVGSELERLGRVNQARHFHAAAEEEKRYATATEQKD